MSKPCQWAAHVLELTVDLEGEFLGLAVVAVLLQVVYGELLQGEGSLQTQQHSVLECNTQNILCNIPP